LGIDYEPGEKCASEAVIEKHLEEFGYIQLNYVGQKFATGMYNGDEAPVFNQNQWFGGYRMYIDHSYYSRSFLQLNRIFTQD
jgi:hypothetical protein